MMKIEIKTGYAAFEPDWDGEEINSCELARVFNTILSQVRAGKDSGFAMDSNGNKVCTWSL